MSKKIVFGDSELKEKTKKISIIEAGFYGVHDGLGIRYITPFALAIGKNNPNINFFIGILNSLPSLIGSLSQLYTSKIINSYKRKSIISLGIIVQSLMWLLVIFSGAMFFLFNFNSNFSLTSLIVFYTLLASFGTFVVPIWTSLMKDIVINERGDYFGKRNRIVGLISLLVALIAGFVLDYFEKSYVFIGFFILFFTAFVFRLISGILFLYYYEPKFKFEKSNYFSFLTFLKKYPESNFTKFSVFVSLFMFAVYVSSPFFTVYMLEDLGFSYIEWTIITITGTLSTILFMPFWGRFIDNYGSLKTLKITGVFIPVIPLIWLLTYFLESWHLIVFLILVETFAGIFWAGFSLSYSNFIYDAVTREKTHLCSAYFNILNGFGIFLGSILGGIILSLNIKFYFNTIFLLFILSAIARFFIYLIMIPKIKEVRNVNDFKMRLVFDKIKNSVI